MNATPVEALERVLGTVQLLVEGIRAQQWDDPTPCSDWNVRDLTNHVVLGNRMFADILSGGTPATAGPERADTGQVPGDVPAACREVGEALLAAFRQPGALERMVTVPFGTVPGIAALHLRITELLAHGWDLARATGQPAAFPEQIVERELEFSKEKLAELPPDRKPFAPPQPVAEDAPAIDRLAACLGRSVR